MNKRIWLITGASSGLGKSLVEAVMQDGDFAIGTFRKAEQAQAFTTKNEGKGLGLILDLRNPEQIAQVYEQILAQYGRLDVLVNNAGYGLAGAIEETSIEEARGAFEANFFGALQLTQAFLPLFRKQRSGHIIQISSHGGFKAFAGFGIYNASKFALEGFSEALAQEVALLGIKLSIVEPGPFRTNFASSSFQFAQREITDYVETAGVFRQRMAAVHGKQEGDPQKAADAIISLTKMSEPPLRLPLGKVALATIQSKLDSVAKDLEAGKAIAERAVYS